VRRRPVRTAGRPEERMERPDVPRLTNADDLPERIDRPGYAHAAAPLPSECPEFDHLRVRGRPASAAWRPEEGMLPARRDRGSAHDLASVVVAPRFGRVAAQRAEIPRAVCGRPEKGTRLACARLAEAVVAHDFRTVVHVR